MIANVREAFIDEGVDEQALTELKQVCNLVFSFEFICVELIFKAFSYFSSRIVYSYKQY